MRKKLDIIDELIDLMWENGSLTELKNIKLIPRLCQLTNNELTELVEKQLLRKWAKERDANKN